VIKQYCEIDPVMGTQLGIAGDHDGRLPPVESGTVNALLDALARECRQSIERSLPGDPDDSIDFELAASGIRRMQILNEALRPHERNPDWYLETAMSALHSLLTRSDLGMDEKAFRIAQRLAAIPAHLHAGRSQIRRPPSVLVETAAGNVGGAIEFCRDLAAFIESVPSRAAQIEIEHHCGACLEALVEFSDFIASRQAIAVDDFAVGEAAFNQLLSAGFVPHDSRALSDVGVAAAGRIERDLRECSLRYAGHADWPLVLGALEAQHPAQEALLEDYREMVEDCRRFVEQRELVDVPPAALEIVPTPMFARANLAFAAYIPAPPFAGGGTARFWVTPASGNALALHHPGRMVVAAVHETYPGHHVQFSHALRVRRPLRHLFGSTVFIEGWGLYSEELMMSAGFKGEDSRFELLRMSLLRDQLWRALRIVIDVGLHCGAMSSAEAVDLLVDRHVLDRASARAEVLFYCSAPTQPMSYMVGKLLIEALVEKCRASGEERFQSLPGIHNELLAHGALPVPLLERALRIA